MIRQGGDAIEEKMMQKNTFLSLEVSVVYLRKRKRS